MSVSKFIKTLVVELDKKRKKKKVDISKLADFPDWMQQLIVAKEPTPDFDNKALYHKHLDEKYGV